jgi:cell migration-inducing and hyaluronan-binding protein
MLNDGVNDSVVTDDTCAIHPTWIASVCRGDVGRLYLSERPPLSRAGTPVPGAIAAALARPPAPEAPIALVRNGREFHITGNQRTVRAGTEIEVKTERPKVTLSVSEMDQGSWVIFQLPGFATAASGREQASLDALRKANETSYFRDGDVLWVKLVVTGAPRMPIRPLDIQASVAVTRGQAVATGTATTTGADTVGKS